MKKIIVTTLILTLALFIFTPGSFAKKDKNNGNGAFVCTSSGEISGLEFFFDVPLEVILPIPGLDPIYVSYVLVTANGSEMATITPSKRFNYHATLWGGDIYAEDEEGNPVLFFVFDSGTLNEHFVIEDVIPPEHDCDDFLLYQAPDNNADVNLFFKAIDAEYNGMTFDIMLKLNHFVKFKF